MKANYLCPWHKVNIWFSPLSRILAASRARDGAVNYPVPILRRFVLIKNRVLAVSGMGDKAPPVPVGRNGGYDPCAVGERIQLLRKERELTQDQLAIDLNISDRYMRNLERGERVPSIDLFVELREKFGSSLDYIVLGITASEREQIMQKQLQETCKALKEMQQHIQKMLELLGESA